MASAPTSSLAKVAVVVGVGPGVGRSVSLRFAAEGYHIALISRDISKLLPVQAEIQKAGGKATPFAADASVHSAVQTAFNEIRDKLGKPEVLVFNAGAFKRGQVHELTPADFENAWKVGCLGAFLAVHEVINDMRKAGKGTIIFTGATAATRGSAGFAGLAVQKFGVRALAQSLARENGPLGIHVAHVIVDGVIDESPWIKALPEDKRPAANALLQPEHIAQTYWQLHAQHPSVWTFELDIRPNIEKW